MADLSKLRFNGTDYNVKDASAPKRKFDNTYAKTGNLPITSDDTTQTAIGKLEKAIDQAETNILYNMQNGVKNLCPLDTLITSGGETNHADVDLPAGTYHIYCTTTASTYSVVLKDANNTNLYYRDHSGSPLSIDVTISGTAKTFYIWNSSAATFSNVMICPKVAWDAEPNVLRPYSLPNSDLTNLEADDRAALVEVVDSGAKNIAKENSFVFQEPASGGWEVLFKYVELGEYTAGTEYVISFGSITSTDTDDTVCRFGFDNSSRNTLWTDNAQRGTNLNYIVTIPEGAKWLFILASSDITKSYNDTLTVSDLMICPLADWKVSQKFVPYRPNWDTIGNTLAERTANLSKVTVTVNTTYTLVSGLSYTTKASAITRITAVLMNASSTPVGIIISKSNQASLYNNAANLMAKSEIETTDERKQLEVSCTVQDSTATTYYVWAKSKTSASNIVKIIGEIIG